MPAQPLSGHTLQSSKDHEWKAADDVACACAGSDALGQAAAALASISIVFKSIDAGYAASLLANATELFRCADSHIRGRMQL